MQKVGLSSNRLHFSLNSQTRLSQNVTRSTLSASQATGRFIQGNHSLTHLQNGVSAGSKSENGCPSSRKSIIECALATNYGEVPNSLAKSMASPSHFAWHQFCSVTRRVMNVHRFLIELFKDWWMLTLISHFNTGRGFASCRARPLVMATTASIVSQFGLPALKEFAFILPGKNPSKMLYNSSYLYIERPQKFSMPLWFAPF